VEKKVEKRADLPLFDTQTIHDGAVVALIRFMDAIFALFVSE
jgi:hypothetical protein